MRRRGLLSTLASLPALAPLLARAGMMMLPPAVRGHLNIETFVDDAGKSTPIRAWTELSRNQLASMASGVGGIPGRIGSFSEPTPAITEFGAVYREVAADLEAVRALQQARADAILASIPQAIANSAGRQIATMQRSFADAARARTELVAAKGPALPPAADVAGEGATTLSPASEPAPPASEGCAA